MLHYLAIMQKERIGVILEIDSLDRPSLLKCVSECDLFAQQIVIVFCDQKIDGTLQDRSCIQAITAQFNNCCFIEYPYLPELMPRSWVLGENSTLYWTHCSRIIGAHFLNKGIETAILLNQNQIPSGAKLQSWFSNSDYHQNTTMKFTCSTSHNLNEVLLIQTKIFSCFSFRKHPFTNRVYEFLPEPKRSQVTDSTGEPLFHDFEESQKNSGFQMDLKNVLAIPSFSSFSQTTTSEISSYQRLTQKQMQEIVGVKSNFLLDILSNLWKRKLKGFVAE
jgi:hypothetical protein